MSRSLLTKSTEDVVKRSSMVSKLDPKLIILTQAIGSVPTSGQLTLQQQYITGYSNMKVVVSVTSIVRGSGAGLTVRFGEFELGTSSFADYATGGGLTANPYPLTLGSDGTYVVAIINFTPGQIGEFLQLALACTAAFTSGTLNFNINLS